MIGQGPNRRMSTHDWRVLQMAADGMSNKEIADTLGCGRESARKCLYEIRRVLGAQSVIEAIRIGVRRRMIEFT